VAAEFETQQMLFDAGVSVPKPVECNGDAIVMEWLATAKCRRRNSRTCS
jgi:RIO-like serine/threonine protein kinase